MKSLRSVKTCTELGEVKKESLEVKYTEAHGHI
jgi:hypothetical protein